MTELGSEWRATTALRISMGKSTTEDDIERFAKSLSEVVTAYRLQK
jgi:cysteine sulfinate desulfinase/cysteine desulfurase-like protein